jgi:arylsulfatase A-like enzyme
MIVHCPSKKTGKIGWLVQSIDLYPTIIDYSGFKLADKFKFDAKNYMFGRTLKGLIEGDPEVVPYWKRPALSQIFIYSRAIREGDWKLIWGLNKGERVFRYNCDEFRLYDMKNDPGESKNLAEENPDIVTDLTGKLENMMRELEGKKNFRAIPFKMYLDTGKKKEYDELVSTLIGLGYLSGAQLEKMLSSDWTYDENASEMPSYDENCGCKGRETEDPSIKPWQMPGTNPSGV